MNRPARKAPGPASPHEHYRVQGRSGGGRQHDDGRNKAVGGPAGVTEPFRVLDKQNITSTERASFPGCRDLGRAGYAYGELALVFRLLAVASARLRTGKEHRRSGQLLRDARGAERWILWGKDNVDVLKPRMALLVGIEAGDGKSHRGSRPHFRLIELVRVAQ